MEIAKVLEVLATSSSYEDTVAALLPVLKELPQAATPTLHHFSEGIYMREMQAAAGTFIIGRQHKVPTLNIMLKGKLELSTAAYTETLTAPLTFTSSPNSRKAALVVEDVAWLNVFPTNERDVMVLEELFFVEQSETEHLGNSYYKRAREDFLDAIDAVGFTAEQVYEVSRNTSDCIPFPPGTYKVAIARSYLEGVGLFVSAPVEAGEVLCMARIEGKRTPAGRYTNHGHEANAEMLMLPNGDVQLVAKYAMQGSVGGTLGQEVFVDYCEAFLRTMGE